MKRTLFSKNNASVYKAMLFAAALFTFNTAFSQSITPGIRVGLNISNWHLSDAPGVETLSLGKPNAGAFATVRISQALSVEPGVTFSYAGATLKYSENEKVTSQLSYLQIPVVARYELLNGLTFFAGPQFSFLLKATTNENDGEEQNTKPAFNKNDFSIVSGLEYYFPAGIGIRATYTAGLTDVYTQGSEKIRNYSYGISVAYKFNVAEK